jgi:ABC-type transporter Mla MlaB component
MPPKEEGTGFGLLSKVVKFVKSPTTNWGGLDEPDSGRESSYSKQMLKEMIERKRRNDFVRKREFDMLRKMRRSEVMAGQDPAARPSFFQSSMPSRPDDRATTLKKIDEIEAQMSMQWWKSKHGDNSRLGNTTAVPLTPQPSGNNAMGSPAQAPGQPGGFTRTKPQALEARSPVPTQAGDLRPTPSSMNPAPATRTPAAVPPTFAMPLEQASPRASAPAAVPQAPAAPRAPVPQAAATPRAPVPATPATPMTTAAPVIPAAPSRAGPTTEPSTGGFSQSKQFAIDVGELAHDPELEEAAIRFANGDDAGAEAGLREVLGPNGSRVDHDETWLTLFDLYRATGQLDRYETAAIDFAGRFGRSAPQWISLPEAVGRMNAQAAPAPAAGGNQAVANWTSPATLGTQSIAAMNAALAKAQAPWKLSWAKLNAIDAAAVEPLTKQFTQWALQSVQLRFIDADKLEQVLKNATPSGDNSVDPAWWKLRMEVLRVMHRPDEFELVALDYCVTYEVSPPSWESARCEYKPIQADGSAVAGHSVIEAFRDSMSSHMSGYSDTAAAGMSSQMMNIVTVELAGQVLGDAGEALDVLDAKTHAADMMNISCSRLIRIDFTAAGGLLNWVSARQAEGRQVQFLEVHRLVAAFFNVIGISEHARVMVRTD